MAEYGTGMLALLLVSPLLGLDNLAAAASLGLAGWSWRTCLRVCAVFGAYAAVAPLAGLLLGERLAAGIGAIGRPLGGGVLVLLGLLRLLAVLRGAAPASPQSTLTVRALLVLGAAVSTDTLAAGFGLGLSGVPILTAVVITSTTTMLMTFIGFRLAALLGHRLGGRGDLVAGAALAAVGAGLIVGVL